MKTRIFFHLQTMTATANGLIESAVLAFFEVVASSQIYPLPEVFRNSGAKLLFFYNMTI